MHNFFKFPLNSILLGAAMFFASCSNEEPFQQDIDPEKTLAADATIIEMMKRITSNDGSYDNIVDGASCLDIQFPYSVTINGLQLTIEGKDDLRQIENILDAADDGENNTEIVFPITIITADYSEIMVNGIDEFREQVERCVEGGGDDDIECIDMVYPVGLFTYDPNLQQTGNVTVNHDMEMRRFLAGLADSDLIGIDFPLTFEMFDGSDLVVNNNAELAAAMERAIEICDEDDDDDYNDDDFTKESLDSLLVVCPWSVRSLERTNLEDSEEYQGNFLLFREDGQVVLEDGSESVSEGTWSVSVFDFKVFLTMEFKDAEDLNGMLYTYRIGENTLKLDGSETDDGETNEDVTGGEVIVEIVLEQSCDYEPNSRYGFEDLRRSP